MRVISLALAAFAVSLSGCVVPGGSGSVPAARAKLEQDFTGVIYAVRAGETLFAEAYGEADVGVANRLDHRFRVGSISKTFTAALATTLERDGVWSLDDPIGRYVKDVPNGNRITIRQLLEHRSGLGEFDQSDWRRLLLTGGAPDSETVRTMIVSKKPRAAPDKEYRYNNVGYVLVGMAMEQVSGLRYRDLLQRVLLAPLAMENTGVANRDGEIANVATGHDANGKVDPADYDYGAILAAGGVYSDAADLARWCEAQDVNPDAIGWRRGERFGHRANWHPGNANDYSALLVHFPEIGGCYVVLSNTRMERPPVDVIRTIPQSLFGAD